MSLAKMSLARMIIIGGVVLVVLTAGLATIFRADNVDISAEIIIDANLNHVWRTLVDPDLRPRWMGGVTGAAQMTGGPGHAGGSMILTLKVDQFSMTVFEDTLDADPPFLLRTRTTDNRGTYSVEAEYGLESAGNGEGMKLTVHERRALTGTWATWFAPFIEVRSASQLEENLARLRDLAQTGS